VSPARARITAACVDAAAVVGFVALGRSSHSEGEAPVGITAVAAPFLIGAAIGWLAVRRTRRPAGLPAGTLVWACTAGIGLLLRAVVFERPTPIEFVAVGAGFLALMLLGWRVAWARIARRRGEARSPSTTWRNRRGRAVRRGQPTDNAS